MARQPAEGRRIGILGGTFDPPHVGHLVTAISVREQLDLDEVLLVVSNVPWQKVPHRDVSSARDRFDMVAACVRDVDGLAASDIEIRRGGDSFTIDTVVQMQEAEPDDVHVLVLGSDAAGGLSTWERWEELASLCRLAVVRRPGSSRTEVPDAFAVDVVEVPRLEVSSSDLRARVAAGLSVRFLVPDAAISLIEGRRLYRVGRDHDGR